MASKRETRWRRTVLGLSTLLVVAGAMFALLVADTVPMILNGANDVRHYAWTILSGLAAFLAFVLAASVYRLSGSTHAGMSPPASGEPEV